MQYTKKVPPREIFLHCHAFLGAASDRLLLQFHSLFLHIQKHLQIRSLPCLFFLDQKFQPFFIIVCQFPGIVPVGLQLPDAHVICTKKDLGLLAQIQIDAKAPYINISERKISGIRKLPVYPEQQESSICDVRSSLTVLSFAHGC